MILSAQIYNHINGLVKIVAVLICFKEFSHCFTLLQLLMSERSQLLDVFIQGLIFYRVLICTEKVTLSVITTKGADLPGFR